MIEILNATTEAHLNSVRDLLRSFLDWQKERNREDLPLINRYFGEEYQKELADLPGKYSPPKGRLLLALFDGDPAGCVALQKLDSDRCEMKRMFVHTRFHGKGIGRELAAAIVREAKEIGYERMLLDTSFRQVEALKLYESVGFKFIEPYYDVGEDLKRWLVFMELKY
jgi:GNAT superfamily N-acetyltransferase